MLHDTIRQILDTHAKLPLSAATLDAHADLYAAGMSSHASVNVMLALEDAFAIEFPDEMLTRQVFGSIAALAQAIERLRI